MNQRIRDLTSENSLVTQEAIEKLQSNPVSSTLIQAKDQAKGSALSVDDYRQDEQLRVMVITNIVQQQKEHFAEIFEIFNPKIKRLEVEIQQLGKGV